MALHRIIDVTLGVPSADIDATAEYYMEFGLSPVASSSETDAHRWFASVDGGRQFALVPAAERRLVSLGIGVDDEDDLRRIAASLDGIGVASQLADNRLDTCEPVSGLDVRVEVAPRIVPAGMDAPSYNGPGNAARRNLRSPCIERADPVRPRRLGHVGIGSNDEPTTRRFFREGLGFKVSDEITDRAVFLRCSSDHHNVMLFAAPVNFLHHTSWEVDDVDEVGRGAAKLLAGHPERYCYGLGRHWVGSNFFYYLRDPAGYLSEYYSDMDQITEEELWTVGVFDSAADGWGPAIPVGFGSPAEQH